MTTGTSTSFASVLCATRRAPAALPNAPRRPWAVRLLQERYRRLSAALWCPGAKFVARRAKRRGLRQVQTLREEGACVSACRYPAGRKSPCACKTVTFNGLPRCLPVLPTGTMCCRLLISPFGLGCPLSGCTATVPRRMPPSVGQVL